MSFTTASAALRALGRMARTAELARLGVTEAELTRAVRTGTVVRPRQGVYALPDCGDELLHAASHGGTVGCCAAARMLGLWVLDVPEQHHIWLGRAGTPRSDCTGCRVHWDDGTVEVGILPPVHNVLLQMAICADEDTFFAAFESALRHHKISPGGITWLWSRLPRRRRWLIDFARSDADSGLESLFRLRMHRLGVTMRCQVSIRTVGEVDFVIGDRLIIEVDGRANHEREKERAKDLARDAAAATLGYETLRFTYAMIVHHWKSAEAAILAKIADRAHLRPVH
ncbi:type IV toxin-antitoxin system AbiEi family antitoxin domain-containing protein [Microbacterium murale]|uniref:Very-short-patch-repair endonuclease n=1 Tax=Microbacterium murale TaxID=1081040 RepID=A0ABU0P505_9MICO|nr:type IV toxin-antitoxin system AbiEi family antitoxin domain-containing protein [Microbacterium murale]MDQ0642400.1 very-short-patch-repair endonuclease [Microbacterium murale]